MPVIFSGMRPGLVFALPGVIGGKIIASEHGLGGTLELMAASFNADACRGSSSFWRWLVC